jgi:drug/metabolite transporter (DMT)-like permease
MKPLHLFLLIFMNCFWAASYTAFKALSPYLDAGGVSTLRFGVAGVILLLFWPLFPGHAPRGRDLLRIMLMGVIVFACAPRAQVAGVQMGRAADASVLMALEPLTTSLAAAIFLHEHIRARRWIGFCLGIAGVLLMGEVWRPEFRLPDLAANALIVLSFLCEAAYSIMGKPVLARAGLFKVLTLAVTAGTVVNLLIDGPSTIHAATLMPLRAWMMLGYLSLICTVAGYSLWFAVIREAPVNVVALTVFIQPIIGVAVAMIWLHESLHVGQIWGSAVVLSGLIVGLWRPSRQGNT